VTLITGSPTLGKAAFDIISSFTSQEHPISIPYAPFEIPVTPGDARG